MVRDTRPSQNASSHQIWNYYLKEYRRYAPNTKRDGRTDSAITICLPKFLWGHKNNTEITKMVNKRSTALERSVKIFYGGLKPVSRRVNLTLSSDVDQDIWASTRVNLSSGVCEQHRHRPACASAQSDQRLCYSRFVKYHI